MKVRVRCANAECRAVISVDESKIGSAAACPKCHERFLLRPMAETMAAESETAGDAVKAKAKKPSGKKQIGRFELKKRLGAGGFGTVYLAHDPVLGRDVALKVPNPAVLESPKAKERFLREPKAAAKLQHPNIVAVYDTGTDGKYHYIASAFIEGETLQAVIERDKPKPRQVAEWVRDLAHALQYAHEHGIVHRDVKPHNVMVDALGTPMLMDFGLAHLQDSEDKLTKDGAVMGTPAYMAPEQADASRGEVGPLSDQYALGTVLYQLLTGDTPFSGPPSVLLFNVLNQEPAPPRAVDKKIPKDLETICLKAMTKEPEGRYPDCAALAADLDRYLDGLPIEARPISSAERLARWCKRRPALAGMIGVAAVLLTTVGVVTSIYLNTSEELGKETAQRQAAELRESSATEELDLVRIRYRQTEEKLAAVLAEFEAAKAELAAAQEAIDQATTEAERTAARERLRRAEAALAEVEKRLAEARAARDAAREQTEVADQQLREVLASLQRLPDADWRTAVDDSLPGLLEHPITLPNGDVWQIETTLPRSGARSIDWSPDGSLLALGTQSGTIRIYEAMTHRLVGLCVGHTDRVTAVCWSPNSERLASTSHDHTFRLWQADGSPISAHHPAFGNVEWIDWSPDGKQLVITCGDRTVRLWSDEGTPDHVMSGHTALVMCAKFSPDGRRIASGSYDATIRIWSLDGVQEQIIQVPGDSINRIAWSEDGEELAAGGENGVIHVFEADGTPRLELQGEKKLVRGIAWSPDGAWIGSTGNDNLLRLWHAESGEAGPALPPGFGATCWGVTWSPDSKVVAVSTATGICQWSLDELDRPTSVRDCLTWTWGVDWSPASDMLAVGTSGRTGDACLWTAEGERGPALRGDTGDINCVAWSPDGGRVATAGNDREVRLWASSGAADAILQGHDAPVTCVAWSADGARLVSGSRDTTIRLWHAIGRGTVLVLPGHEDDVLSAAWSPDSRRFATAGADGFLRIWSAQGEDLDVWDGHEDEDLDVWEGHEGAVLCVAWSPDGKQLVSGGADKTVRLWEEDGTPGDVLATYPNRVASVAWSPDSSQVAVGAFKQAEIRTLDGEIVFALSGLGGEVRGLKWSPDGRWIATAGGGSGKVRVYDAETGELHWMGMVFEDGETVALAPDGSFLHGKPSVIEADFLYLVRRSSGKVDVLRPSEFSRLVAGSR